MFDLIRRSWTACWLVLLALFLAESYLTEIAKAQIDTNWSEPLVLFQLTDVPITQNVPLNKPSIVADGFGNLHVFWAVGVPVERSAIYYSFWDGQSWSPPIDVLIGPNLGMSNGNASIVVDHQGYLHVIWHNGGLYYSRAHISQASNPRAWQPPTEIAPQAFTSDLAIDQSDRLHVVYSSLGDVKDVFYTVADADSPHWASPIAISEVVGTLEATGNPDIMITPDGRLHVTWGVYQLPDGWPPAGVYYAQSDDGGRTWTTLWQMAETGHGNPQLGSISDRELHLVWFGDGRNFTRSLDGGQTWEPVRKLATVSEISGFILGPPQLVADSAARLHLVFCGYQNGEDFAFFSEWNGLTWLKPRRVTTEEHNAAHLPSMTLTNGNELHLVWLNIRTLQVMYTWRRTEAPYIAPKAPPPAPVMNMATITPVATTTPTPHPTSVSIILPPDAIVPESQVNSQVMGIVLPTILVLLLLGGITIAFGRRRHAP